MWDIVGAVREGKARFEWEEVLSVVGEDRLYISVMRDAIRFDAVPEMNWHRQPKHSSQRTEDGVRLPATAAEMQQIADLLFCMLPTPKVLDLVWTQASVRFDPVVNLGPGRIVAEQDILAVHDAVEKKLAAAGGGPARGIVASVGKYWVVCNRLAVPGKFGRNTACNYGWHSSGGRYRAVTPGLKVWQSEGTQHPDSHIDPSQVVRLVYRMARLARKDGSWKRIDLHDVARDPVLSAAINHAAASSVLKVLRQPSVPEPEPSTVDGVLTMPETIVYPAVPPPEMGPKALADFLDGLSNPSV